MTRKFMKDLPLIIEEVDNVYEFPWTETDLTNEQSEILFAILDTFAEHLEPFSGDLTASEFKYQIDVVKALVDILCNDESFMNTKNCEVFCIHLLEEINEIIQKKIKTMTNDIESEGF